MLLNPLPSYLSRDPEIMHGALVFAGTRVHAKTLIDYLAAGDTLQEFLEDFPSVDRDQAESLLQAYRQELAAHDPGEAYEDSAR